MNQEAKDALDSLPPCQRKVAIMRAYGMTTQEIAEVLDRDETTVKTHLYRTFKMLNISRSTQLAVLCALAGKVTHWHD